MSCRLETGTIVKILLALPLAYGGFAYLYLAIWHGKLWLFNTVVHENGRLTLLGSLFYFDHFIGSVPMIAFFTLCVAGGVALGNQCPAAIDTARAKAVSVGLFSFVVFLLTLSCIASIYVAGWQRTIEYASQQIERDGILSPGGNWHQLQLSNLPLAVSAIGVASAMEMAGQDVSARKEARLRLIGIFCVVLAFGGSIGLTFYIWPGREAYLNPRWLAHSIREMATYPLTALPIGFASIMIVEQYLSSCTNWRIKPRALSLILCGAGVLILLMQLALLHNVNILAIAQRPVFAPHGLSIPYLLSAHVFEHFLDFILIGPLAGGLYALVRVLGTSSTRTLQVSLWSRYQE